MLLTLWLGAAARAQSGSLVLQRDGRVISLVPYAPNIVRVTISTGSAAAISDPGYGFIGKPSATGWTHEHDAEGDVFRSARMAVRVSPEDPPQDTLPKPMPLDALNNQLRDIYFGGGGGHRPHNDSLLVTTAEGKTLLHMRGWTIAPERPEVARLDAGTKGNRVAAVFDSRADEHYYGLGQQQKGWMDLRDHEIRCWHDYGAIGGEDVCVPFMVSTRGYGLVWDNPSSSFNGVFYVLGGADGNADAVLTNADFTVNVIPEPSSLLLLGTGLISLAWLSFRVRQREMNGYAHRRV